MRCDGLASWLFSLKTGSRSSFRSHSDHRAGSVFRAVAWYSTCSAFAIFSERSRHCWALSREDQWSHTSPMIRVGWSWQLRDHGHDHSLIMTMIIFWKTTKFSLQPASILILCHHIQNKYDKFSPLNIWSRKCPTLESTPIFGVSESKPEKYLSQTCEVICYYSNKNYFSPCEGKCGRRNTPTKNE